MSTPLYRSNRCAALLLSGVAGATLASAATAEVPSVATDIAPVHGLVARVMEGLGEPALIVRPGASPHGYAMRPSEARALQDADAVFWVGPELEPWLAETIDTLAQDAAVTELLEVSGTETLEFREGATFAGHDHEDGHGDGDDHAEDNYDEEDHDDHADHAEDDHDDHAEDDHAEDDHDDYAGHDHSGVDPHAWLDPENGKAWLDVIATELAALDPDNAETYRANAAAGRDEIDAAADAVRARFAEAGTPEFVVFHDAYHYFENRFGLAAAGAISLSDASDPSPARVEEVRDTVRDLGVDCVFSEPQFDQRLVQTVLDGTEGQAAVVDPLGFEIETGPGFYPALIEAIGTEIADCAS
ncbi:zinc transport system substrate-binding protein [Roseivivax marinus]|uniref:zinc ABC transporter substrate-binding protein n=1 Tax=Roseivivax marinus TaxID=1379903 RepID=UPI0008D1F8BA|nr:zinc ABC transporter substrate-binding protein [Roseivivax marinus]SEK26434.1 zinc transport system substrate-binding protein [Roseivivax marinus]